MRRPFSLFFQMSSDIIREWAVALRSGEWKQYRGGTLGSSLEPNSRCCLGVLCEVAKKHKVIEDYNVNLESLPYDVWRWSGLRNPNGVYREYLWSLANHNDGSARGVPQMSFEEIAKLIEEKQTVLFRTDHR